VRKLCVQCRRPGYADDGERNLLGAPASEKLTLYYPQGCDACGHTGYRGRTGIYELMVVNDEIRHLIHDSQGEQALRKAAREYGMRSLREDGIAKVMAGETSLEEVLRVAQG
jgi:general secretion pathway protein E